MSPRPTGPPEIPHHRVNMRWPSFLKPGRKGEEPTEKDQPLPEVQHMWSRRVVETWFGILAVIALAVLMAAALHIPKPVLDSGALGPALFPLGLLVLMIVIQAVLMVQRVLARIGHVPASFIRVGLQQRRLGLGVVASIVYLGLMPWAGYVLTTACFVFAMLFIFRPQSARPIPIWGMAAYAAVIGLASGAIFMQLFQVPLPTGVLSFAW